MSTIWISVNYIITGIACDHTDTRASSVDEKLIDKFVISSAVNCYCEVYVFICYISNESEASRDLSRGYFIPIIVE